MIRQTTALIIMMVTTAKALSQDSSFSVQQLRIERAPKIPSKYFLGDTQIPYDTFKSKLLSSDKSRQNAFIAFKLEKQNAHLFTATLGLAIPAAIFGLATKLNGFKKSWYDTTFVTLAIPTVILTVITHYTGRHQRKHLQKAINLYNTP